MEELATSIDTSIRTQRVATFGKVSFEQFKSDMKVHTKFNDEQIKEIYDNIKFPKRSTSGSAGYDIFAPFDLKIPNILGKAIVIPTGIKCCIDNNWCLKLFPRSGSGFKYGVELFNTVGIIDSDYFYADNEGHIMVKLRTKGFSKANIEKGKGFCQGIFEMYGITYDDHADGIRTGGFGSTDQK